MRAHFTEFLFINEDRSAVMSRFSFPSPLADWNPVGRSWSWILVAISLSAVIAAKGMGSILCYQLAVAGSALLCAFRSFNYRQNGYAVISVGLGIVMIVWPWFAQLPWFFVALFVGLSCMVRRHDIQEAAGYDALALGMALLWCAGRVDEFTAWVTPKNAAIMPVGFALLLWRYGKTRTCAWLLVLIIATFYTAQDIVVASKPKKITVESYSIPNVAVYPHGKVIANLVGGTLVPKGEAAADIGIVNMIFGPTPNRSSQPIYLIEHGVGPSEQHPMLDSKSLLQRKPWEYNQLFGDEYVLAAISRDGYWASNLGGSLKAEGRVMLGSLRHEGGATYEPVIIRKNGATYVQDSDPFVDWLANGQREVVWELTHGALDLRCLTLAAVLTTALALFASRWSMKGYVFLVLGAIVTQTMAINRSIPGDIYLVGRDGGPHEISKSAGVVRSLVESGRPVIESNRPSSMVVVSCGETFRLTGVEKLVIMAPNSRVVTKAGQIEAGDVPLGHLEDVVDARSLRHPGGIAKGFIQLDNVVFIATGSPAKLNWEKWFPHS